MFERILVPLDHSELAETVLPVAQELATRLGAEVILLEAVRSFQEALHETTSGGGAAQPSMMPELGVDVARRAVEAEDLRAHAYLETVAGRLQQAGLTVRTLVRPGPAVTAIIEVCQEEDVTLVAMSTHGRSGIARTLMGSVADQVLRNSHVPLLLVTPKP